MTIFDAAYILAGLLLVGFELAAIIARRYGVKHQTISHKVIAWIALRPRRRRAFVIVGLGWLLWHWAFQSF
jgi:hypothetical protein